MVGSAIYSRCPKDPVLLHFPTNLGRLLSERPPTQLTRQFLPLMTGLPILWNRRFYWMTQLTHRLRESLRPLLSGYVLFMAFRLLTCSFRRGMTAHICPQWDIRRVASSCAGLVACHLSIYSFATCCSIWTSPRLNFIQMVTLSFMARTCFSWPSSPGLQLPAI